MKYLMIGLSILTFVIDGFGQSPVIEGMYLPVRGTRIEQVYDTVAVNIDIPSKGENQVWDYSNKFTDILDTFELATKYPETTPYYDYYPEATHASFLRAPFGFGDSLWIYFLVDTAGIHNIGMFGKTGFGPDTNLFVNPSELMMPSEVSYQGEVRDTSVITTFVNYSGVDALFKMTSYKRLVGEGYGTLSTPIGTFDDVVLGTEYIHHIDSIFPDVNGDGVYDNGFESNEYHVVRYNFLRNNTFGSTHLMHLKVDSAQTVVDFGWYTLPVDFGSIKGQVFEDETNTPVVGGEALLYREHSNFSKDDILARAPIDINGNYQFDSIPYGEYRIAARAEASTYPYAYSTYYGDTVNWLNASIILTSGDTSDNNNITMRYFDAPNGNGRMAGYLSMDLSVGDRTGNLVPGIDIIVEEDPESVPVLQLTTDESGYFDLSTLEPGNYKLWVDVPGLDMAGTYYFEVTDSEVFEDLNFTIGIDSIYPEYKLGISEEYTDFTQTIHVYPNPVTEKVTLTFVPETSEQVELQLFTISGKLVHTTQLQIYAGVEEQVKLDLDALDLPSGTYFITFQMGGMIYRTNIVKF